MIAATAIIAGTLLLVAWQFSGTPRHHALRSDRAFFSDDDGKTYFQDSVSNFPPFDHNGTTAYGATVLRCSGGKPFVAYLQKYDPATVMRIQAWMKQSPTSQSKPALIPWDPIAEVKKPGESNWFSLADDPKNYARVTSPTCPDGSVGPLETIMPGDGDTGAKN